MILGQVVGEVWATRKAAGLEGRRLKLVAVQAETTTGALRPTVRVLVALDTLDARTGQEVLVAEGSGGRNVLRAGPQNRGLLCDAAIALLVEPDRNEEAR